MADAEDCFRVNVFYAMLDIVNTQMKQRFAAMVTVTEKFAVLKFTVLNPAALSEIEDFYLTQKAKKLQEDYPDDL